MSEPKKFQCQSARPSDFITVTDTERLNGARCVKVAATMDTLYAWVLLEPERAREFAAEIVRLAAEIDAANPPITKKEEPTPMKKPLNFDFRRVCGIPIKAVVGALEIGDYQLPLGTFPAMRKALDDYEAAHAEANKLTFADLADGDWFRWKTEQIVCRKINWCGAMQAPSQAPLRTCTFAVSATEAEQEVVRLAAEFEDAQ